LNSETAAAVVVDEPPPKVSFAREALLEEARRAIEVSDKTGKKGVSIVVIGMYELTLVCWSHELITTTLGHVDAGKSTLMGRLLYDLGRLDEKTKRANEKGSTNAGKSSFSWAWGLDGTAEERQKYAVSSFFGLPKLT
jgi:elongation factor 1 alpha-like protein